MSDGVAFIGVDLAWKSERNPSGIAVLVGDRDGAELERVFDPTPSLDHVLARIRASLRTTTVVAVDAPLIIPNQNSQRDCERLLGRRYGAREASCHTSNLTLYPDSASVALSKALGSDGFVHSPSTNAVRSGRVLLEVFPHAALVALFKLDRIIKYKKGSIVKKRVGLEELRQCIRNLAYFDPPLMSSSGLESFLTRDLLLLRGRELKSYEDALDAVVCAYLAFYFWVWRDERNEVFGDLDRGYIVNPTWAPNLSDNQ